MDISICWWPRETRCLRSRCTEALVLYFLTLTAAMAQSAPPQATQHGLRVDTRIMALFDPPEAVAASVRTAQFETWVEELPSDYAESILGGFSSFEKGAAKTTLQRFVRDHFRRVYVSYQVEVEALAEAGAYRVTFGNSTDEPPADLTPRSEWKVGSPPNYPVPQILREGDEIRLELFTHESGAKLVDYLHIGRPGTLTRRKDAARDSYAEDAEFSLSKPRLSVNGTAQASIVFPETIRGSVLWIYVPGHGRYVLAFNRSQDLDMASVGEVTGGQMILMMDGNLLRIESSDRIAPGGGAYNVYGLRDAKWQPADPEERSRFMAGTSPGVELAIGR